MLRKKHSFLTGLAVLTALTMFAGCVSSGDSVSSGVPSASEAETQFDDSIPVILEAPVNDTTVFDDIPADEIAERLSPGWNVGNQLEGVNTKVNPEQGTSVTIPSETAWNSTPITNELLAAVKKAGFRFVRIPVSYFSKIDDANGYKVDDAWLARIKEVVDMCVANNLYCMINMHGDGYTTIPNSWLMCADKDPEHQKQIIEKYSAVWKQVAEMFTDYDESVIFESMNEEFDGSYNAPDPEAYENINAYNEAFVKTVRATGGNNAKRWLLIPGWNTDIDKTTDSFGKNGHFKLPKDDHLMVSVHYYTPWGFCGGENGTSTQWGSFTTDKAKTMGVESLMAKEFNKLRDTFTSKEIPVVIGEWGTIDKTTDDPTSIVYREYFATKLCENCKRIGAVPVYWDNGYNGKYGFALFNRGAELDEKGNVKKDADSNPVKAPVSVTQQGIVNAIMRVYATPDTDSTATITFDQSEISLKPDATVQINATIKDKAEGDWIKWESSDETVAVVKNGLVKPMGEGECYIYGMLPNQDMADCKVTVGATGGITIRLYSIETVGWSTIKSDPIVIEEGAEKEYTATLIGTNFNFTHIGSLYFKDVEVEENGAATSAITSCPITVESFSLNGIDIPLVKNENIEAINDKGQFDMPILNEWATDREMIEGFPASGDRSFGQWEGSKTGKIKLSKKDNTMILKFKTLKTNASTAKKKAKAVAVQLDDAVTYHAYFGIQAADSWVFRNSYANGSYGGGTDEFKNGLFDTENAISEDGHVPGNITDTDVTKADIEAGKSFTVKCTDFSLADSATDASALNLAMITTDIPYGSLEITGAKLFFDGKQVNLDGDGNEVFQVAMDNGYYDINFINIWDSSIKTFSYSMPATEIKMEFTCKLK